MKLSLMRMLAGALAALGVVCAGPAMATNLYNSNNSSTGFDATATGSIPSGWTATNGTWVASTTVPNGTSHPKTFAASSATNLNTAVLTGISATADISVKATQNITSTSTSTGFIGVGVRGNSAGTTGYLGNCSLQSSTVTCSVYKSTSGAYSAVGSSVTAFTTGASTVQMNIKLQVVSNTLSLTAWPEGTAEPTSPSISVTDSSSPITTAGYAYMLYNTGNAGAATAVGVADFEVDDTPYGETNSVYALGPAAGTGGSITIQGQYLGTLPTGLGYALDGSTSFTAASSPSIGSGTYSFTVPSLTAGTHQMTVRATNATTEVSSTTAFSVSGTASTTIAPNNAGIYYSPCNWGVSGSVANTINAGAYFKTIYTGTSVSLNFDMTTMPTNAYSQIWYRIDGIVWTQANVAATVVLNIPTSTTGITSHFLEVVVKSTTEFTYPSQSGNRWLLTGTKNPGIKLTSISLSSGGTVSLPVVYPNAICILGDSITEGYQALMAYNAGVSDSDSSDGMSTFAWGLGRALNAEFGIVGFGGQGVSVGGQGSVPAMSTTYNTIYSGGPTRSFSGLTGVIIMQGGNDGASCGACLAAFTTVMNGITSSSSTVPVVMLEEFDGYQAATVQSAIAGSNNPGQFHYVSTAALPTITAGLNSFDGAHPQSSLSLYNFAPSLAALVKPILSPAGAQTFRRGFH